MRANLLRDLAVLPSPIRHGIESYPRTVADILDSAWPRRSRLRRAAIAHAVAFETWQSLAREGLSDGEVAKLIIGLISTAAGTRSGWVRRLNLVSLRDVIHDHGNGVRDRLPRRVDL